MDLRDASIKAMLIDEENESPFIIGEKVLIRTVTFYAVGRIIAVKGKFIVLEDAAWVASTGRFSHAIENGSLEEVEPVSVIVRVNMESIVDVYTWKHSLPIKQA